MTLDPHYCDYAATAPPWDEALAVYVQTAGTYFGNPSSLHDAGRTAREQLLAAKTSLCDAVCFDDGRLLLTSGGTESNNLVINGHLAKNRQAQVLIAGDVHPSVWYAAENHNSRIHILKPETGGRISIDRLLASLDSNITLVSLVHACNETGIIHDVAKLAGLCARREILCHIDGTQAMGHIPVNLQDIQCDYYTFSAHKFGGPRGVGGLFLRDGRLHPQLQGGKQEWELRAGTENLAGLVATATALHCSLEVLNAEMARLRALAHQVQQAVKATHADVLLNSDLEHGLPGLLSLSFPGLSAHSAVMELNLRGFAVSAGSACHADEVLPSRIICALGRSDEEALGTIRIAMGRGTTDAAAAELALAINDVVAAQRPEQPR